MRTTKKNKESSSRIRDAARYLSATNLLRLRQIHGLSLSEVSERTPYTIDMLSRMEMGKRSIGVGDLAELAALYEVPLRTIVSPWSREDSRNAKAPLIEVLSWDSFMQHPRDMQPHIRRLNTYFDSRINLRKQARAAVFTRPESLETLSYSPTPDTLELLIERRLINDLDEKLTLFFEYTRNYQNVLDKYYDQAEFENKVYYALAWEVHSRFTRDVIDMAKQAIASYTLPEYLETRISNLNTNLAPNDKRFEIELQKLREAPEYKQLLFDDRGHILGRLDPLGYLYKHGHYGLPYPSD